MRYWVTHTTVAQLHQNGPLVTATVNNPKLLKLFGTWGVDMIVTDYPDVLASIFPASDDTDDLEKN